MILESISLEATIVLTGRSRRTWWRRLAEGRVTRVDEPAGGAAERRTLLAWAEVQPHLSLPMTPEELALVLRADAGEAEAQNDLGQLLAAAGQPEAALYWLQLAAAQDHADAMQCLGRCHLTGQGVPQDEHLGVMWIAKAAAHGHAIAQAQMAALRPG